MNFGKEKKKIKTPVSFTFMDLTKKKKEERGK